MKTTIPFQARAKEYGGTSIVSLFVNTIDVLAKILKTKFMFYWAVSFNSVQWNTGASLVNQGLVC